MISRLPNDIWQPLEKHICAYTFGEVHKKDRVVGKQFKHVIMLKIIFLVPNTFPGKLETPI